MDRGSGLLLHVTSLPLKQPAGVARDAAPELMELAWSSKAALAMAPLQDMLNLGNEARMNVPGHVEGNWRWRCTQGMISDPAFERLGSLTKSSNRWDEVFHNESNASAA
jgi:4-alpha-glucanotransferase